MKVALLFVLVALPASYCFYLKPNLHYFPTAPVQARNSVNYRVLGNLFHKLHLAAQKCANNFDESCINGQIGGVGSDEGWLGGNGNNPGKRCVNTFDESCANGDINGAGSDDDWLNGGDNPGRR